MLYYDLNLMGRSREFGWKDGGQQGELPSISPLNETANHCHYDIIIINIEIYFCRVAELTSDVRPQHMAANSKLQCNIKNTASPAPIGT